MLSAKKSTIATKNIEFLGMIIKDGHYQPGKHIAQELVHFPDQQLSKKQVQQFLSIINYIRDCIPHVDHYTRHLSALLKKKSPEWNATSLTWIHPETPLKMCYGHYLNGSPQYHGRERSYSNCPKFTTLNVCLPQKHKCLPQFLSFTGHTFNI